MRPRGVCPEKEALQFIASGKDKNTFRKQFISQEKGYGVIATENMEPGQFLLEYVGRHITGSEGEALLKEYSVEDAAFLYFYTFQGQSLCVDGSKHAARLGRFINDDHIKPNSKIEMVMDEHKRPHLCAFAITNISAGEEVVYDYGDRDCPWRQKTITSSCRELKEKESRWNDSLTNLDSKPGVTKTDDLLVNTRAKIADGCDAAELFPGLFRDRKVAVKRVAKHISKHEMALTRVLCSENLKAERLLQPVALLEDSYFAYFVSPLCEYSLMELIENKDFPERESLTEGRRLEICRELLQGLQELHSYRILHRDLKPQNILFDISNKLYVTDFGTSRTLLSQKPGSFSWPSFEDIGGTQYKYEKESDIQVAGCLVHYILTDGQHPYQTTTPYSKDPLGLCHNIRMGNYTLQCEERQRGIIGRMLSKSTEARPTIEECLQAITSFTHQGDCTGTTKEHSNTGRKDGNHLANCSPETSDEMDIQDSDQPQRVCNEVVDTSVCEMDTEPQFSLSLHMSEEDQPAEADGEVTEDVREMSLKTGVKTHKALECSSSRIQVKMSSNTKRQRVYDKKNYCLYCEKPLAKITRHLIQKHQDRVEVAEALAHGHGSTMCSLLLSKIRNQGNYNHNRSVLSSRKGQIVPKRQATHLSSATDYLPCKFCYASYVKTDLWRHHKRCKLREKENESVKRKVQASSSFPSPVDHPVSSGLQKILDDMTCDAVTQLVKSDQLILSLGERMYLQNGEVERRRADIRNKMRELARLVLVARDINKDIVNLKDLISPAKFNTVLEAVKKLTAIDHPTHRSAVPSTALLHSLVTVSLILQGEALRQQDDVLTARAERFSKLIELEWTTHLS